jgi:hypothetical protein
MSMKGVTTMVMPIDNPGPSATKDGFMPLRYNAQECHRNSSVFRGRSGQQRLYGPVTILPHLTGVE